MNEFIQADDELNIEAFRVQELTDFDYLWLLSFGKRHTFLDYMQILWSINTQVKFVNSLNVIGMYIEKYYYKLGSFRDYQHI
ncbi:MAG: hypothetical protein ACPGTO_02855 [Polaribacter sp.]